MRNDSLCAKPEDKKDDDDYYDEEFHQIAYYFESGNRSTNKDTLPKSLIHHLDTLEAKDDHITNK